MKIAELYREANPEEGPSLCEAREAAALATEMLDWGAWSGADFDFLTRVEAMSETDYDMMKIINDMRGARQRERNLSR